MTELELPRWLAAQFDRLHQSLSALHQKIDQQGVLMSDIASEQATIDAAVATFTAFVTDVEAELANLQAANPALDLSKLATIVATAKTDDPGPAPVAAAPVVDAPPVDPDPAPVDAAPDVLTP